MVFDAKYWLILLILLQVEGESVHDREKSLQRGKRSCASLAGGCGPMGQVRHIDCFFYVYSKINVCPRSYISVNLFCVDHNQLTIICVCSVTASSSDHERNGTH